MDAANLFATKGIGNGEADIMSVMVGVARLLNKLCIPAGNRIFISIPYPFIGNILVERIISHKGEPKTVSQHRIAQGKTEITIACRLCQSLIIREPVLIAGIQQERVLAVQISVDRKNQPMSPSVEIWYIVSPCPIVVIVDFVFKCNKYVTS